MKPRVLYDLPTEVLFHIAEFLNASSLGALLCCSTQSVEIFSSAYFWKKQCELHLPKDEMNSNTPAVDDSSLDFLASEPDSNESSIPLGPLFWKSKFADYHRLRRNWLQGRSKIRSVVELEGNVESPHTKIAVDGDAIYVGAGHHLQQFIPLAKGRRSRKIIRVTESINGIHTYDVNQGRIVVAGGDLWDAIHLIDAKDGRVLSKWRSSAERGHVINSLQLEGGRVGAAAIQCTLWDIETLTRIIRVKEDDESHNYATSMKSYNNLFGASWASVAAIYDIRTKHKVATFTAKDTDITQLDIHDKYVSTNSSDGILRIWDQRNFECPVFEIGEHKRGILSSYIDNYKAITLAGNGRIRICDISEPADTINCTSFKFYGDDIISMAVTKTGLITLGESIRINDFSATKQKKVSNGFIRGLKKALVGCA